MWILFVKIIAIVCGNCIEQLVMPIKCENVPYGKLYARNAYSKCIW
jgi:hypothetical protein